MVIRWPADTGQVVRSVMVWWWVPGYGFGQCESANDDSR
ncbi:hypothetical protein Namu_2120 [Nakamurella multipartita DSM 44233]|jgi:hypothetical protein|uniref:Uncharacterized protein n=1 Tax=Nakamurella multipartita (strain ATCC 700099 / DSM 44233 / CIP 104796 / JCM 9543 / NBRC 105858 / Y-104) TaxID=479431 RepID=C8XIC9_NAKMY|nr:hypothetical protein Namu_2120 [Nakamurella multipartita DSM 44233]